VQIAAVHRRTSFGHLPVQDHADCLGSGRMAIAAPTSRMMGLITSPWPVAALRLNWDPRFNRIAAA
jgi:hypothetical protein